MADSILQAGVNYRSVVHPRVVDILTNYPEANELKGVENIIASGLLPHFLKWQHSVKIDRFHSLAVFLGEHSVNTTSDLRMNLQKTEFSRKIAVCVWRRTQNYRLHGLSRWIGSHSGRQTYQGFCQIVRSSFERL